MIQQDPQEKNFETCSSTSCQEEQSCTNPPLAGITHILTDELKKSDVTLTNAKVSPLQKIYLMTRVCITIISHIFRFFSLVEMRPKLFTQIVLHTKNQCIGITVYRMLIYLISQKTSLREAVILAACDKSTSKTVQGAFSHSLAEYAMTACLYFAKCIQELQANHKKGKWEPLYVEELRLDADSI